MAVEAPYPRGRVLDMPEQVNCRSDSISDDPQSLTEPMRYSARCGFTLTELLIVLAVLAVLVGLVSAALPHVLGLGDRVDSIQRLRGLGKAVELYAADHGDRFPGPLWPGQVPEFDPAREGRLVRELADYLGIERKPAPYLVESFIPRATRRAMGTQNLREIRVYVVRPEVEVDGKPLRPFGLLTGPRAEPLSRGELARMPQGLEWMVAEADQKHPVVSGAPWRSFTPAEPLHHGKRAVLMFDGSVRMED